MDTETYLKYSVDEYNTTVNNMNFRVVVKMYKFLKGKDFYILESYCKKDWMANPNQANGLKTILSFPIKKTNNLLAEMSFSKSSEKHFLIKSPCEIIIVLRCTAWEELGKHRLLWRMLLSIEMTMVRSIGLLRMMKLRY